MGTKGYQLNASAGKCGWWCKKKKKKNILKMWSRPIFGSSDAYKACFEYIVVRIFLGYLKPTVL